MVQWFSTPAMLRANGTVVAEASTVHVVCQGCVRSLTQLLLLLAMHRAGGSPNLKLRSGIHILLYGESKRGLLKPASLKKLQRG